MKKLLGNTLSNALIRVITIGANLVLVPILIQNLGVGHYGLLILGNSIIGNFIFLDAGLESGVTRFVAKYMANDDKAKVFQILNNSLTVYCIIALLNFTVLIVVYLTGAYAIFKVVPADQALFSKLVVIAAFSAFIHWPAKVFSGGLFGLQLYYLNNTAKLFPVLLAPLGVIVLSYLGVGLLWVFIFQQSTYLFMWVLQFLFIYKKIKWVPMPAWSKSVLKEIYSFSVWVFLINLPVKSYYSWILSS